MIYSVFNNFNGLFTFFLISSAKKKENPSLSQKKSGDSLFFNIHRLGKAKPHNSAPDVPNRRWPADK